MMEDTYKIDDEESLLVDNKKNLIRETSCVTEEENQETKIITAADTDKNFKKTSSPANSTFSLNNGRQFDKVNVTRRDDKLNMNVILAASFAYLSSVTTGSVFGWSSPTLPKLLGYGEKIHVTREEGAWLSSVVTLGALFGLPLSGLVVDKIGRKWTIIMFTFIVIISWCLLAFCDSIHWLYMARIIAGVGVGGNSVAVPMYISEISPTPYRATLGSICVVSGNVGTLLVYSVGPFTSYLTLIMVCTVPPFLCIVNFLWIPESFRYLLNKGYKQEALNSLLWFRGYPSGTDLSEETRDIEVSTGKMKQKQGSICDLFKKRIYLKCLFYTCAYAFFQQMSGLNAVRFYAHSIFQATGSDFSPNASAVIIASMMLATTTCAGLVSKFFGMRRMLLFSTFGNAVTFGVLALYFFLKDGSHDVSSFSWLPLVCLICFVLTCNLGLACFLTVIINDIYPAHLKGVGSSITLSFYWITMFLVTRYYPVFNVAFGRAFSFGIFSVSSIFSFLFILFQLPDTQGKSFEEIQHMLTKKQIKRNRKF